MTPRRAMEIISDQAMCGIGAKLRLAENERETVWEYVQAAPISMRIRDMLCRIGRDENPVVFPDYLLQSWNIRNIKSM